jgi:hypothetical protein
MSPCIGMHYPLKGHVELGVEVHKFLTSVEWSCTHFILGRGPTTAVNTMCKKAMVTRGGVVVKALRHIPAGRGFDSRWCHWNFSVTQYWIGHILRRNCLLKQVIEGKIKGKMEVARRWGRRRKKLLDDLNPYLANVENMVSS